MSTFLYSLLSCIGSGILTGRFLMQTVLSDVLRKFREKPSPQQQWLVVS